MAGTFWGGTVEFIDVMRKRRMIRNFTAQPVADEVIDRIVAAGHHAPSAGFSQGIAYVVVTDEASRRQVAEIAGEAGYVASWFDPFISGAPVQIIICTSERVYHDTRSPKGQRKSPGLSRTGTRTPVAR